MMKNITFTLVCCPPMCISYPTEHLRKSPSGQLVVAMVVIVVVVVGVVVVVVVVVVAPWWAAAGGAHYWCALVPTSGGPLTQPWAEGSPPLGGEHLWAQPTYPWWSCLGDTLGSEVMASVKRWFSPNLVGGVAPVAERISSRLLAPHCYNCADTVINSDGSER